VTVAQKPDEKPLDNAFLSDDHLADFVKQILHKIRLGFDPGVNFLDLLRNWHFSNPFACVKLARKGLPNRFYAKFVPLPSLPSRESPSGIQK
jgi:hypothetical protein